MVHHSSTPILHYFNLLALHCRRLLFILALIQIAFGLRGSELPMKDSTLE